VLTTKAGKPRKRGPAQEVTEGIAAFSWHSTSGRPAGRGKHWVDMHDVTLKDGTKLHIRHKDTYGMKENEQHVFVQGDVTYEFFWPNRAENTVHKTPQRRRKKATR